MFSGHAPADSCHWRHSCHESPQVSYNGTTTRKGDTIDYPINYSSFRIAEKNNRYWATVYMKGMVRNYRVSPSNFVEIYLDLSLEYEGFFDATSPEENILVAVADTIAELNRRKVKDVELLIRDKINDAISTE